MRTKFIICSQVYQSRERSERYECSRYEAYGDLSNAIMNLGQLAIWRASMLTYSTELKIENKILGYKQGIKPENFSGSPVPHLAV